MRGLRRKIKKNELWCMKIIKNNKKPNEQPAFRCQPALGSHSQSLTNKLFFSFFFVSLTRASRAHDEKGTFLLIFKCFWSFSTMPMHAQACICWSKYTTTREKVWFLKTFQQNGPRNGSICPFRAIQNPDTNTFFEFFRIFWSPLYNQIVSGKAERKQCQKVHKDPKVNLFLSFIHKGKYNQPTILNASCKFDLGC